MKFVAPSLRGTDQAANALVRVHFEPRIRF